MSCLYKLTLSSLLELIIKEYMNGIDASLQAYKYLSGSVSLADIPLESGRLKSDLDGPSTEITTHWPYSGARKKSVKLSLFFHSRGTNIGIPAT